MKLKKLVVKSLILGSKEIRKPDQIKIFQEEINGVALEVGVKA